MINRSKLVENEVSESLLNLITDSPRNEIRSLSPLEFVRDTALLNCGRLDVLKWAIAQGCPILLQARHTCMFAGFSGDLPVLPRRQPERVVKGESDTRSTPSR